MRKGSAQASDHGAWLWLGAAAVSVLLLPWYGVEGGVLRGGWPVPAVVEATAGGRIWLLPLLLPLLAAAWALHRRKPRLLVACGAAALAWLLFEAFGLRSHGLRLEGLAEVWRGARRSRHWAGARCSMPWQR
ncbi:hypothetical protein ACFQU7_25280 [Pseudoroseomonas wenyumeiae]